MNRMLWGRTAGPLVLGVIFLVILALMQKAVPAEKEPKPESAELELEEEEREIVDLPIPLPGDDSPPAPSEVDLVAVELDYDIEIHADRATNSDPGADVEPAASGDPAPSPPRIAAARPVPPPPASDPEPIIAGTFTYSETLANRGEILLGESLPVIHADYQGVGFASYMRNLARLGARAFVVRNVAGPEIVAEIDPISGAIVDRSVTSRKIQGLALAVPRVVSTTELNARRFLRRVANQIGARGALDLYLVLPANVEGFALAALERAVEAAGMHLSDFQRFEGRYQANGSGMELQLQRGLDRRGTSAAIDVIIRLPVE